MLNSFTHDLFRSGFIACLAVALTVAFAPHDASAEVVRYKDKNGDVHYVEGASKVPPEFRDQLKDAAPLPAINKGPQFFHTPPGKASGKDLLPKPSPRVDIYVTSWCPYCKKLEAFLQQQDIPFNRYDVEADAAAQKRFKSLGGSGVPMVKIGSQIAGGFNPDWILQNYKR